MASSRAAPRRGDLAGGEEARQGGPEALAQADQIVHRHAAASVEGRGPLPVFTGTAGVVGRHAECDTFGEQLSVSKQVAQAGLVVAPLHGRIGVHGEAQGSRAESLPVAR